MNRRAFLRSVGLTALVVSPATSPAAGQTTSNTRSRALPPSGKAVADLLTPQVREAAFMDSAVTVDASWSIVIAQPVDARAVAMAQRMADHVTRLGGPHLSIVQGTSDDSRRQIVLSVLALEGISQTTALLATSGRAAEIVRVLSTRESVLPSRGGDSARRRREAYYLSVDSDQIALVAGSVEGLLLGGQTLM